MDGVDKGNNGKKDKEILERKREFCLEYVVVVGGVGDGFGVCSKESLEFFHCFWEFRIESSEFVS